MYLAERRERCDRSDATGEGAMIAAIQHGTTRGFQVKWDGLWSGDKEGEAVAISEYPNKTILIEGGSVKLLGKMAPDGEEYELADMNGAPVKGPGWAQVVINPMFIRPV